LADHHINGASARFERLPRPFGPSTREEGLDPAGLSEKHDHIGNDPKNRVEVELPQCASTLHPAALSFSCGRPTVRSLEAMKKTAASLLH
jgi:hypothetical protein